MPRRDAAVEVRLTVHFDAESKSFWADSPDMDGLIVSGATPDELLREAHAAASALLELGAAGDGRPGAIEVKPSFPELERAPA